MKSNRNHQECFQTETARHDFHVGHFKCRCGQRLKFGAHPGGITSVLKDQSDHDGLRVGICPVCGAKHQAGRRKL